MPESYATIPMPTVLADPRPAASDHDPATSHEHGPIEDRPERDPAGAAVDAPIAEYGRQMWTALEEVARYLLEEVARGGSGPVLAEIRPLLSTEEQWQRWRAVYGGVLSVLAGPHGDEGYGEQEAQLEYQNRGRS